MTVIAAAPPQKEESYVPAPAPPPVLPVRPVTWFFVLLGLVTLARLYLMVQMPLTGDEAYYWQWSRHLALGYYDHPPMIGWTIALFNGIFGRTLFATRLAGPFYMTITTVFLYLLGRDLSGSRHIGAIGASLFIVVPLPAIGGMAVVPDAPMMAFWAVSLYALQRAIFSHEDTMWTWAGVGLGLAIMSKLMAFFLIPSLFVFLLASKPHRPLLRTFAPYRFVLVGLLVASPFLAWNATHHWATFLYQATSRMQLPPSPHYFIDFMAYEAAALSPLLFVLAMVVLVFALRQKAQPRLLFLAVFCACILLSFIAVSFRTRAGGHWPFPGYISLMSAMALVWQMAGPPGGRRGENGPPGRQRRGESEGPLEAAGGDETPSWGRSYRVWFRWSVGLAASMTLAVYLLLVNPDLVFRWMANRTVESEGINKGHKVTSNDLAEIYGYEELAAHVADVQRTMQTTHPTFVFTDSYTLSSIIAFYSGLDTHVARGSLLGREYWRWDHFDQLLGQDAVYIDLAPFGSRPDIAILLSTAFTRIEAEDPMQVFKDGQAVRKFYVIRCYGFKQNIFQPTGGVAQ